MKTYMRRTIKSEDVDIATPEQTWTEDEEKIVNDKYSFGDKVKNALVAPVLTIAKETTALRSRLIRSRSLEEVGTGRGTYLTMGLTPVIHDDKIRYCDQKSGHPRKAVNLSVIRRENQSVQGSSAAEETKVNHIWIQTHIDRR
jgi:hypothetical protein